MMVDYAFKNGIKIHIPDEYAKTDRIEQWTHAKMLMSILLDPPEIDRVEKKPYTFTEATIRKRLAWKEKKERDRQKKK